MRISQEFDYPADLERVASMMTDPAFQEAKCRASHAISQTVAVTPGADPGAATVTTTRVMPTRGFPDFAKRFVGETLPVTEVLELGAPGADGSRRGPLNLTIEGLPVTGRGSVTLTPSGPGTQVAVEMDLKASIPLIGGKIEQAAAPVVTDAIRVEHRTGERWLAEH